MTHKGFIEDLAELTLGLKIKWEFQYGSYTADYRGIHIRVRPGNLEIQREAPIARADGEIINADAWPLLSAIHAWEGRDIPKSIIRKLRSED